jgi:hypothetical protein
MGDVLGEPIPVDLGMSRKFEGRSGLVLTPRKEVLNRFDRRNALEAEWIDIETAKHSLPGRVLSVGMESACKP